MAKSKALVKAEGKLKQLQKAVKDMEKRVKMLTVKDAKAEAAAKKKLTKKKTTAKKKEAVKRKTSAKKKPAVRKVRAKKVVASVIPVQE